MNSHAPRRVQRPSERRCSWRPSSVPGIMGERLAGGNVAIALLANTIATGATLVALILTFGPISGAHFNPAVTLADASQGGIAWRDVPAYLAAQLVGAVAGVLAAHLMFGEAVFQLSEHVRAGGAQLFSEFVATFGLLAVIWGCSRRRAESVPMAVGLYITGAYWFTASTSFANPAVTIARCADEHLCRHSAGRRAGVHRGAASWRRRGNRALSVARAGACRTADHVVVPRAHQRGRDGTGDFCVRTQRGSFADGRGVFLAARRSRTSDRGLCRHQTRQITFIPRSSTPCAKSASISAAAHPQRLTDDPRPRRLAPDHHGMRR